MNKSIQIQTMAAVQLFLGGCESKIPVPPALGTDQLAIFPSYITPVEDYFDTSIGNIPDIAGDSYKLKISGAVKEPRIFSLKELHELEMFSLTLTTECIGNPGNGYLLVGTNSLPSTTIFVE